MPKRVVQFHAVALACILGTTCFAVDFDAILRAYRRYELPEPDTNAVLISYSGKRSGRPAQLLGFADLETRRGLFGVRRETVHLDHATVIKRGDKVDFKAHFLIVANDLPVAIQLYARGNPRQAERLWNYLLEKNSQSNWSLKGIKPVKFDGSNESIVATIAFAAYRNQLYHEKIPWREVARQLVKIDVPTGYGEYGQSIIDSLKAALQSSDAKPGSVETLIDRLLERDRSHAALKELAGLGFEAIPTLIDHADDIRWTPHKRMVPMFLGGGDNTLLVRDHVMYLLKGFLAPGKEHAYQHNPIGGDHLRVFVDGSGRFQKQEALGWYRKVLAQGEEDYLMAHVFPEGWIDPNPVILQTIISKYPRRFEDLYNKMLRERPDFAGENVATFIDESRLPDEVRIKLFSKVFEYPNADHRVAALKRLVKLDKRQFLIGLHDSLTNMATAVDLKKRGWIDETEYVSLVRDHGEKESRDLLTKAVRRAAPVMRLEMLEAVARSTNFWTIYASPVTDEWKHYARTLLAEYLKDATVRVLPDDGSDLSWGYDSSSFRRIEIRDFAAYMLAATFSQQPKDTVGWDKAKWAEFRESVRMRYESVSPIAPNE